jgi:7-carboxy-7-deazaguanine synthase
MPEGKDPNAINEHAQQLASEVIRYGWNLTTRLHVLLYGNRRGV